MRVFTTLNFGHSGNAENALLEGWSIPEEGFTWAVGEHSSVGVNNLPCAQALTLEIDVAPFLQPPFVPGQRLAVWAGDKAVGHAVLHSITTLAFDIPDHVVNAAGGLIIKLIHPDASIPASFGPSTDQRRLSLMVRAMRLIETASGNPILPRCVRPLRIAAPTPAALDRAVRARTGVGTTDLLRSFESLGHNCEFGLLQRVFDAEPLGLLRFAGIEPAALLSGLEAGFAGIADTKGFTLESGRINGRQEYLVRDARFGVRIHTGQFVDELPPEEVDLLRMARHLGYLQRHFAEVLREADRIFVIHHPDLQNPARVLPILHRLRAHGNNTLLYVSVHPTVQPGTIVQERAHLFHGYIDRLVPMREATMINLGGWVSLCANTYHAVNASQALTP